MTWKDVSAIVAGMALGWVHASTQELVSKKRAEARRLAEEADAWEATTRPIAHVLASLISSVTNGVQPSSSTVPPTPDPDPPPVVTPPPAGHWECTWSDSTGPTGTDWEPIYGDKNGTVLWRRWVVDIPNAR